MFRTIRLRLIAYVVGVLTLVLLAVGALVYVLLTRQLDAAVEAQLRARLPTAPSGFFATTETPDLLPPLPPLPGDPSAGMVIAPGSLAGPGAQAAPAGTEPSMGFVGITVGPAGEPAGGAFVSIWLQGKVVSPKDAVPPGLPDLDAMAAAHPGHDDERTVRVHGQRYRLVTRVMPVPPGGPSSVVQAGVSLATRDREERIIVLALAGGGLLGIVLTVAGGLFLTSRALAPLQLAFERQRRFVADASHELRTPLALVRLEAENLAERLHAAGEVRPLLGQVSRVSRLVDSLLTLARLDHGALPVELEPVHVASFLDVAAAAGRRLAAPGVSVLASAPGDAWVTADPAHLSQILLILVDNACRVTPRGGTIALTARSDGAMVVITIADTGPGIAPEHLGHVFERFYRADAARSRTGGGTGLGLAIAQELAQAQHGRIELASGPGGTTAIIRLRSATLEATSEIEGTELVSEA